MAAEIIWSYVTGKSGYAIVRSSSGTIFNRVSEAFEDYDAANYLTYQMSGQEQSSGRTYVADFPSVITTPGYYNIEAREQIAGSGLQSDQPIAVGEIWWNGTAVILAADLRSGHRSVSGVLIASGGVVPGLISGVFTQSGIATAVQVSGIATGFAFVSGVSPASGYATAVQVSGLATYANISGITQAFVSGVWVQSGIATSVQVSGLAKTTDLSGNHVVIASGVQHGGLGTQLRLDSTTLTPALYMTNSSGKVVLIERTAGTNQPAVHVWVRSGLTGSNNEAVYLEVGDGFGEFPAGNALKLMGGGIRDGLDITGGASGGAAVDILGQGKSFGLRIFGGTDGGDAVKFEPQASGARALNLVGDFHVRSGIHSLTFNISGGIQTNSGLIGPVGWLSSGINSLSGIQASMSGVTIASISGLFTQSGIATAVQVSGVLSGITHANISGVLIASGYATASQLESYLPVRLVKDSAFSGFVFKMDLSGTIGLPLTSGNLTAQRTSGATKGFADLPNAPIEIGAGWYRQNFVADDLNDDAIGFKFTDNSGRGVQRDFTVITQRSG